MKRAANQAPIERRRIITPRGRAAYQANAIKARAAQATNADLRAGFMLAFQAASGLLSNPVARREWRWLTSLWSREKRRAVMLLGAAAGDKWGREWNKAYQFFIL